MSLSLFLDKFFSWYILIPISLALIMELLTYYIEKQREKAEIKMMDSTIELPIGVYIMGFMFKLIIFLLIYLAGVLFI